MTIKTSGVLSLTDVMTELRIANSGRAYPISLGDADVLALVGKASAPVSLTDLYGKSAYIPMRITGYSDTAGINTSGGGGTAICIPYVTYNNGLAPYTFFWEFEGSSNGFTINIGDGPYCHLLHTFAKNQTGEISVSLRCTVTDGTGRTVTVSGITGTLVFG